MGIFKDVFDPRAAERDRYNKLLAQKRRDYPVVSYNSNDWKSKNPSLKLNECQELGTDVKELRLLKEGKTIDSALSDGHRVDERGKKVYSEIYDEYSRIYKLKSCDPVLQIDEQNKDILETNRQADILQARIEKNTDQQRTTIIAVGGVVLLIGTVLILKKF